jgi:hypothetical protein
LGDFYPLAHGEIWALSIPVAVGFQDDAYLSSAQNATWVLRRKVAAPESCERCKSYRITVDFRPDLGGTYVPRCEACGEITKAAYLSDTVIVPGALPFYSKNIFFQE